MMLVHLKDERGIKKVLKGIKALDEDVEITHYHTFYAIESDKLDSLVRYDYKIRKVVLDIYQDANTENAILVPVRLIDCVY